VKNRTENDSATAPEIQFSDKKKARQAGLFKVFEDRINC